LSRINSLQHNCTIDSSWLEPLSRASAILEPNYIACLNEHDDWLPGKQAIFSAFALPLPKVHYILFGESPYPRAESANGHAFWDAAVHQLWSATGLAKQVNRATSLRHIVKMLLVASGKLKPNDTSQAAIATIDKQKLVQTIDELFHNLIKHGFLLLNASLVLSVNGVRKDARIWQPFMQSLLNDIAAKQPQTELILWGKIAQLIDALPVAGRFRRHYAEHPYNVSFVTNPQMLALFQPLKLLEAT